MSTVRYSFFGEDQGQRAFLAAYLRQCSLATGIAFEAVTWFGKRFGPMNNKVVDRRCGDACREAFVLGYPTLEWLFIGRDVDAFDPAYLEQRAADLWSTVPAKWRGQTVLMLPVQCIEHWFLYLARHPDRTALERKPNDQTKDAVYADTSRKKEEITTDLLSTLTSERMEWLAEASQSFLAFHTQVQTYLAAR